MAELALLVPLPSQDGRSDEIADFLSAGYDLVQNEPETLQWFAVKYADKSPDTYAIFDTFAAEKGRQAHLGGPIAAALMQNAPQLVAGAPEINSVDVIASKVGPAGVGKTAGLKNGLRVLFSAKDDKVETVRDFLKGALPLVEAENDTLVWYAIHFPGTAKFGIVDFFPSEEGRKAHLNGKVAAALFGSVDELLTGAPDVVFFDVHAADLKA